MKQHYINELAEGSRVDSVFAVRAKEWRSARSGDQYLALELADRTGQLPALLFRPAGDAGSIPVGAVVRVVGRASTYRGIKRILVDEMTPAAEYDPADLLAAGPRSRDELLAEIRLLVGSVTDAGMRAVLRAVFGDKEFLERFLACPGAQSYHHAYVGGLAEHTAAVARLCAGIAESYPGVDGDLLVTAALVHDIGKVDELSWSGTIEYTDRGRLLGHVVLGSERLRSSVAAGRAKVSAERMVLLEHAVLSHHGELEWGSPKRPSTLEALLLHHADNLDAKAAGFQALAAGAARADEVWTDAANLFRRPLYAPRPAEDDRQRHVVEDDECHLRSA